jgi:poly(A) polymerase
MQPRTTLSPVIIPRSYHSISRRNIDPDALKVLYRLHQKGYKAYLVGGSVRDMLLGKSPKDFDVGTNAHPAEIKKLFRNCRIIGRRFRIAHIYFKGGKIIEVSTFRKNVDETSGDSKEGEAIHSIHESIFGEPYEDALRRDLTINGLLYDIATFSVVDYVGGIADLKAGIIRAIGNPDTKFLEDPVRMIRAIRHAARTGFLIEEDTYQSILEHSHLITTCNKARLLDEFQKDLISGCVKRSLELLLETGILKAYVPPLALYLENPSHYHQTFYTPTWIWSALEQLDQSRDHTSLPMTVFYLPILFPLLEQRILEQASSVACPGQAYQNTKMIHGCLKELAAPLGLPRKDIERLTMLWMGIHRLERSIEKFFIPVSLQRKSYFHHLIDVYRLKWVAAGSSPEEVDANIQKGLWKGKQLAERHRKRRTRKTRY